MLTDEMARVLRVRDRRWAPWYWARRPRAEDQPRRRTQ